MIPVRSSVIFWTWCLVLKTHKWPSLVNHGIFNETIVLLSSWWGDGASQMSVSAGDVCVCVCAVEVKCVCVPQRIRSTVDEKEQKQLLMDLDVVMRSSDCPYIVQFYGALFREVWQSRTVPKRTTPSPLTCWGELTCGSLFQGDCWICMELMSTSLDKFYKYVYCALEDVIPEEILGKITLAVRRWLTVCSEIWISFCVHHEKVTAGVLLCLQQTVKALNHLKENLKIIHRGKILISVTLETWSQTCVFHVVWNCTLCGRRHQTFQHSNGPKG